MSVDGIIRRRATSSADDLGEQKQPAQRKAAVAQALFDKTAAVSEASARAAEERPGRGQARASCL